ncbi:DUF92 domain-containing protein [Clostridium sp. YIM B02515]|uniref:DUF92 domain-containing protein n=1 Tax=Clostridium rhizosphaerae TaxID=2803861 RepID=A0ABS1T7V2_9CLOT|nr:DUF92 domain-containing protein [Clostridium rhizosphaerae]MBL4935428.1 DUF92 domain-containing protein [Clostridium rhizosphaerae]
MKRFIIGFVFSSLIVFGAYKKKSLDISGALSAIFLGTCIYFWGGLYMSAIMISFFISSSFFTKIKESFVKDLEDINEKTGARDYMQVAANGGIGLVFAFLYYRTSNPVFLVIYAVAFSASNADTWASELGVLSTSQPISILSFKKVEKGISGAVSLIGTLSAICGALFIALIYSFGYVLKFGFSIKLISHMFIITLSGFIGSLIDSIIGAAFQAKYKCSFCGRITEKKEHHGQNTIRISGIRWINNDFVNFISGLAACAISIILYCIV